MLWLGFLCLGRKGALQEFKALNSTSWLSSRETFTASAPRDFLIGLGLLLFLWHAKAPAILEFVSKQWAILLIHLLLLCSKLLGYVLGVIGGFLLVSIHPAHTTDHVTSHVLSGLHCDHDKQTGWAAEKEKKYMHCTNGKSIFDFFCLWFRKHRGDLL